MILVGLDDTDMPDTPGTNQLARHLVQQLSATWSGQLITRHQLLTDPRVPCTRKNGCVAIAFEQRGAASVDSLIDEITSTMRSWCPAGSDPGLCVTSADVPRAVVDFGIRCKHELVTQAEARELAAAHEITLMGLGGTRDGVIGALAAIGLMTTRNDGRVIYNARSLTDHYHVCGVQRVGDMKSFGVDEVRHIESGRLVESGSVDVGKRLRPNFRAGRIVLYVSPSQEPTADWCGERVL